MFEVGPFDEGAYDLLLNDGDEHALRTHFRKTGVSSLLKDGLDKVARGVTSVAELRNIGGQSHFERSGNGES